MSDMTAEDMFLREINGMPLFLAQDKAALDIIEAAGHEFYFVIASEQYTLGEGTAKKFHYQPTMFRVTKNILGRAIVRAQSQEVDLPLDLSPKCWFSLPKLPWTLLEKMDRFFRKSHELHGTESVLILTYDPTYLETDTPALGWGCIAPTQKNSAASCDYEFESVLAVKPAHVSIAGSAHSHPNMEAYFSGIDHHDQADWDGLHITFAWKGNGPTDYHIGLMIGGVEWPYTPEEIFDTPPRPEVDYSEVDDWVKNVSKNYVSTNYGPGYGVGGVMGTPSTGSQGRGYQQPSLTAGTSASIPARSRAIKLPEGAPDPTNVLIVAKVPHTKNVRCPFCKNPIAPEVMDRGRRCPTCMSFVLFNDDNVRDLNSIRQAGSLQYDERLDVDKADQPIVVWAHDPEGKMTDVFSNDVRTNVGSPKV